MALSDELKTLQELHETGKLTDQEYADAKAGTLKKKEPDENRVRRPFLSWPVKALLLVFLFILLFIFGLAWYNEGTRKTTQMIATAVHAPLTLKDEVENVPANSWRAIGLDLPYSGSDVVL